MVDNSSLTKAMRIQYTQQLNNQSRFNAFLRFSPDEAPPVAGRFKDFVVVVDESDVIFRALVFPINGLFAFAGPSGDRCAVALVSFPGTSFSETVAGIEAELLETDTDDWSGCGAACGEGEVDFRNVDGTLKVGVADVLDIAASGSTLPEATDVLDDGVDVGITAGTSNSTGRAY